MNIVTNEDCMIGMERYPDKYFDLAIVDPPYGIGENGDRNKSRGKLAIAKDYKSFSGGDKNAPNKDFFIELKRISKNQIIFGANHFIENIPNANSSCWIVWDKNNGESDFADCELAYTSFINAVRKFEHKWQGMLQQDMKNKERRIHPTQKPVSLYRWILSKWGGNNFKILDTHVGSGSSRIACHSMGFDFIGFELDKDYFDAQEKRYRDFKAQTTIEF